MTSTAGDTAALASWTPVWLLLGALGLAVVLLALRARRLGRSQRGPLLGVPAALEQLTGVPAWAVSTVLVAAHGLVVAGYGFYTDVAWHVALGRDEELFTAPHTAILVGLCTIAAAPVVGVVVATATRVPGGLRVGSLRVPWSLLPLGVLGVAGLIGFPVDDLWHRAYGVDVTMWSPPHLVMILAASFSGLASWLVLADAGVRPTDGGRARALHVLTGVLTLLGLSSVQGEYSFGVPQWQQLYHPVLVCLAAGTALVLVRIVLGRGWALAIASGVLLFELTDVLGDSGPVDNRPGALYVGSALAVELVAALAGTERRLRFAILSGLAVGTAGLGVEWWWNQDAHQPWTAALLPEAVVIGVPVAVAAAVIGAAVAGAVRRDGGSTSVPGAAVVLALLVLLAGLLLPAPRRDGDVTAAVSLDWVDEERAVVEVVVRPPDAAEGANWFTAGSWQWGGNTVLHLEETAPGRYRSPAPLPLAGGAKALLRLHRGDEMMAVPLRLPADPEYGLAEVAAVDRTSPFESEQQYLQRESERARGWFAWFVHVLVLVLLAAWLASMAVAVPRVGRTAEERVQASR